MNINYGKYTKQISFGISLMLPGHDGYLGCNNDRHWDIIIDFGIWYLEFTFGEDE